MRLLLVLTLFLGGCATASWNDTACPVEETSPGVKERVCTCREYRIKAAGGVGTQFCDSYQIPVRVKYEEVRDESP